MSCKTNDDCIPVYAKDLSLTLEFKMILIAPVSPDKSWDNILEENHLLEPE